MRLDGVTVEQLKDDPSLSIIETRKGTDCIYCYVAKGEAYAVITIHDQVVISTSEVGNRRGQNYTDRLWNKIKAKTSEWRLMTPEEETQHNQGVAQLKAKYDWLTPPPKTVMHVEKQNTRDRVFSFSEAYGPFDCEVDGCGEESYYILLDEDEYQEIPPGLERFEQAQWVFKHRKGTAVCEDCLKKIENHHWIMTGEIPQDMYEIMTDQKKSEIS